MARYLIAATALLFTATTYAAPPSSKEVFTGSALEASCRQAAGLTKAGAGGFTPDFCLGVIHTAVGVIGSAKQHLPPEVALCVPEGVSYAKLAKGVVKWMEENREESPERPSYYFVVRALQDGYGCSGTSL